MLCKKRTVLPGPPKEPKSWPSDFLSWDKGNYFWVLWRFRSRSAAELACCHRLQLVCWCSKQHLESGENGQGGRVYSKYSMYSKYLYSI